MKTTAKVLRAFNFPGFSDSTTLNNFVDFMLTTFRGENAFKKEADRPF